MNPPANAAENKMKSDRYELNYSKVKSYLFCPFYYKYMYLDEKYPAHNPRSSLGVSVHGALARHGALKGDLEDLFIYYDRAWINKGYETPQQEMEYYGKGRVMLENFWLSQQERKTSLLKSEVDFEFKFEKWTVRGTIDRIDKTAAGETEVIDYKIGFEGEGNYSPGGSLQLGMYALGCERGLEMKADLLSYWFLNQDRVETVPRDRSGDEKILTLLRETGEKISEGDFSRKGDCLKCSIAAHCCHK